MRIQWRYLDIQTQRNTSLIDIRVGASGDQWLLRLLWKSPTTIPYQLSPLFVKISRFTSRYIVHPTGGGAARLVCEECGAEYPYVASPSACAFCAVMKESGISLFWRGRLREWLWSDWGWAVKEDGYYMGEPLKHPMPPGVTVTRFKSTRKIKAYVDARIKANPSSCFEIGPYPIKPVQPVRDPIMDSIIRGGPPGIGARPGIWGDRKGLLR